MTVSNKVWVVNTCITRQTAFNLRHSNNIDCQAIVCLTQQNCKVQEMTGREVEEVTKLVVWTKRLDR